MRHSTLQIVKVINRSLNNTIYAAISDENQQYEANKVRSLDSIFMQGAKVPGLCSRTGQRQKGVCIDGSF